MPAGTVPDTTPEEPAAGASLDSAVEGTSQDSAPVPRSLDEEGSGAGMRLPAWAWWVGAIVVVLLLVFGIRAMLNPESDERTAAEIATEEVAVDKGALEPATEAAIEEKAVEVPVDERAGAKIATEAVAMDNAAEEPGRGRGN